MIDGRFVFGVDLDGVCVDFITSLRPIAAEWLGVEVNTLAERVSWGLPEWGIDKTPGGYEALYRFAVTQRVNSFVDCRRYPALPKRCENCQLDELARSAFIWHEFISDL